MKWQESLTRWHEEASRLKAQGNSLEAERLEARAAQWIQDLRDQAASDPKSPETAEILLFLADREWAVSGDQMKVQSKFERALAIVRDHFGEKDVRVAEAEARLAEFHYLAGRSSQAEAGYRRSLSVLEGLPEAPLEPLARTLAGLAVSLADRGQRAEADPYFERAIALMERQPAEIRRLYFLYISRAEGLVSLGRAEEAAALREKAIGALPKGNPGVNGFQV